VQPKSDLVITSTRTDRADPVNIAEAIRIGAPTCDFIANLNYVTTTRIDMWNSDH
jgi:hypothetical protein